MMHYLEPLLIGLFVLIVLSSLVGARRGGEANVVARDLMTAREIEFWRMLRRVADPYHVAPQVAMSALLKAAPGMDPKHSLGTRNRFDRKYVDFALVDERGSVRLLIELDDRTHLTDKDATRDRMTARAGYTTLRVTGRAAREPGLLASAIADKMGLAA
jgi:hypothetical protein